MAMDYQDYYKILGVEKTADEKQIKQAFRKLARKYHPDATGGDKDLEKQFKQINEAYEVLSDADKRAKLIDRLLDDPRYAGHQADVWDLVLFGRNPPGFDTAKRDGFHINQDLDIDALQYGKRSPSCPYVTTIPWCCVLTYQITESVDQLRGPSCVGNEVQVLGINRQAVERKRSTP